MPKTEQDRLIRFGVFELGSRSGELRSKGSRVKLQDRPLHVLLAVLGSPGKSSRARSSEPGYRQPIHLWVRPWAERGGEASARRLR